MARRLPKAHDARERLLEAATVVFAEKGVASTNIADIAKRAGITRGGFYYYFTSKADIAADLQRKFWQEAAERASNAFDPSLDTVTNMKRAFEVHLDALGEIGAAREFLYAGFTDPDLEASSYVERQRGLGLVHHVLSEAMEKGEIIRLDVVALADILTELFEVSTRNVLRSGDPRPTIEVVGSLLDGLVPPADQRSSSLVGPSPTLRLENGLLR